MRSTNPVQSAQFFGGRQSRGYGYDVDVDLFILVRVLFDRELEGRSAWCPAVVYATYYHCCKPDCFSDEPAYTLESEDRIDGVGGGFVLFV